MTQETKKKPDAQKKLSGKNLKYLMLAFGVILGVALLLLGNDGKTKNTTDIGEARDILEYSEMLEAKITALCESTLGVGKAFVVVTLEGGFEEVYAKNELVKSTDNGISSEKEYVIIGNGSSAKNIFITEKLPTISGIGIVCEGGGNPQVQRRVIELISAAFGVSSSKIYVAAGGNYNNK